jgi:hypothetical protein
MKPIWLFHSESNHFDAAFKQDRADVELEYAKGSAIEKILAFKNISFPVFIIIIILKDY